jgi:hypothetical protein
MWRKAVKRDYSTAIRRLKVARNQLPLILESIPCTKVVPITRMEISLKTTQPWDYNSMTIRTKRVPLNNNNSNNLQWITTLTILLMRQLHSILLLKVLGYLMKRIIVPYCPNNHITWWDLNRIWLPLRKDLLDRQDITKITPTQKDYKDQITIIIRRVAAKRCLKMH